MTIHLNGRELPLRGGQSLAELLAEQGIEARAVATARNGQFVPIAERGHCLLQPGDRVLCFQPITGG